MKHLFYFPPAPNADSHQFVYLFNYLSECVFYVCRSIKLVCHNTFNNFLQTDSHGDLSPLVIIIAVCDLNFRERHHTNRITIHPYTNIIESFVLLLYHVFLN